MGIHPKKIVGSWIQIWLLFLAMTGTFSNFASSAHAFEMVGLVGYDLNSFSNRPTSYVGTKDGIGYAFFGRLDFGPGMIESGFVFTSTSMELQIPGLPGQTYKLSGNYWMIPLLYRYYFFPPFLSLAVGGDFAVAGDTTFMVTGTPFTSSPSHFKSHFGAQVSLEAAQDLGENLSAVIDLRYRAGIGNAISIGTESAKYNVTIFSVGIQKRLD